MRLESGYKPTAGVKKEGANNMINKADLKNLVDDMAITYLHLLECDMDEEDENDAYYLRTVSKALDVLTELLNERS